MAMLNPEVLEWAVRRSGLSGEQVVKAFPKYRAWLDGSWKPTVKQLRDFANKTHVSVSELFGSELPDYALQIADFRTVNDTPSQDPSPELFDTIDAMMGRQDWLRDYFLHEGYDPVGFVGSYRWADRSDETGERVVSDLRGLLKLNEGWAASCKTVAEALRMLKDRVEAANISVVINGVVNDNTHRALDVDEFRGFVLADDMAPIIFINGRDAKSAQIFTLVHELCHLAFAQTGVSNAPDDEDSDVTLERFCNAVAADFLVPTSILASRFDGGATDAYPALKAIAHTCKVNFVVVARKAKDMGLIDEDTFFAAWRSYKDDVPETAKPDKVGGNYFLSKQYKLGSVFSEAVLNAVNSDYLSYRDAYDLTGLSAPSFKTYFEKVA
ncbi:ImmA/IrrE family metallo-endopeptidase [Olsenella sp. HMSC062G07]|uniref:ImmA/IrrE family metallo-endopeptidase n=1 Tax=Olsenella sp. HMSC062G07 TaxID=1739330 RepID=UPI0008A1526D|nr:ImmA/IrrE family metallo-endopeptidase [Olsenella sp. HMSC062G07]OFK22243.1 hypothetical protein HMPREF2826_02210 [Olsenella sp. HMSC062G07]